MPSDTCGRCSGPSRYLECNNIVEWRPSHDRGAPKKYRGSFVKKSTHIESTGQGGKRRTNTHSSLLSHGANETGRSRSKFLLKLGVRIDLEIEGSEGKGREGRKGNVKRGGSQGRAGRTTCFRENCPLSQVAKIRTFERGRRRLSSATIWRPGTKWKEGRRGGILFDLLSKNDFLACWPSLHASVCPENWPTRQSSVGL